MPRPYSVDLREHVVGSVEGGLSRRETAKRFQISVSFVIKLLQRWRENETVEPAPFGHVKTTTFLAGLRHDSIMAPCVFDGPINGQRFLAWVEQALSPTLKPSTSW